MSSRERIPTHKWYLLIGHFVLSKEKTFDHANNQCYDYEEQEKGRFCEMLRKFTLISNNICYGPCPEPSDEIKQRLTVTASGRVWFTGYVFGKKPGKYPVGRKGYCNIGVASAQKLLDLLERYFSGDYLIAMATDVGSWELYLHSETVNVYRGSLCEDLVIDKVHKCTYIVYQTGANIFFQ